MDITITIVWCGIFKGQVKVSDGESHGYAQTLDDAKEAYEDARRETLAFQGK